MSPKILLYYLKFCHVSCDSVMSLMILSCHLWSSSCHFLRSCCVAYEHRVLINGLSTLIYVLLPQIHHLVWFMSCRPWFMSCCPWFMSCRNWSRCQCFVPIFLYFPNISSLLWLALFSVCEYFAMKNKFPEYWHSISWAMPLYHIISPPLCARNRTLQTQNIPCPNLAPTINSFLFRLWLSHNT